MSSTEPPAPTVDSAADPEVSANADLGVGASLPEENRPGDCTQDSGSPEAVVVAVNRDSGIDYEGLLRLLLEPLLEVPASLRVDCERAANRPRLWLRLAVHDSDRGRVLGRSGRTIQALRTFVATVAKATGETATIEMFGEREAIAAEQGDRRRSEHRGDRGGTSESSASDHQPYRDDPRPPVDPNRERPERPKRRVNPG